MLNFDAFDLVEELPPGRHACDMVWVDEWRGDRGHDFVCVRTRLRESGTTCLRERQTRFSSSICWQKQRVARTLESLSSTFPLHSCTLEQMGNICESTFRYQEFKILEIQGSSEWNEESIKALASVLI